MKKIEEVIIGDTVLSWNGLTNAFEYEEVIALVSGCSRNFVQIYGDDWSVICTNYHPFLKSNFEWIEAAELREGDYIYANTRPVMVNHISLISYVEHRDTYNIKVNKNNSYCVQYPGLVVHNK